MPLRSCPKRCGGRGHPESACGYRSAYTPNGQPIELDIKESAEGGMGPHGLCIGATGSGKSEFLRTLVLSLITSHSPESLNLVLVDFKGGATFLGLEGARARRGHHHQPRRRTDPGRPHARRAGRRDEPPPGAAARRRQLRRTSPSTNAHAPTAPSSIRCPRCSSSSTSSPNCSRRSRISPSCS